MMHVRTDSAVYSVATKAGSSLGHAPRIITQIIVMHTSEEVLDLLLQLQEDTSLPVAFSVLEASGPFEKLSQDQVLSILRTASRQVQRDLIAESLCPKDVDKNLLPVRVQGDGNCFFRSAALLLFGDESHHLELRLRAAELCSSSQRYASVVVRRARS